MLLGKIKLYDIAKELNLTSKDVLEIAKKLNIDAKSHLSSIDEADAVRIKESVKGSKPKKEEKKPEKSKTDRNESPVIIRREVIINDEPNTHKEQAKKEEKRNNHVGFVERKQNKDYNIVYRNKPTKPMTVDELFGIKKETKKEEPVVAPKVEEKVEVEVKENKMDVETKTEIVAEKTVEEAGAEKRPEENRFNQNRNNYNNRDFRQNNNRDNNFANRNRFNNGNRNFDRNGQNNANRNFDRNGQNGNNPRFDKNKQGGFNNNRFDKNRQGGNPRFGGNRPLDEKGIERNIKDIMAVETIEKEPAREYNKAIDKQKQNSKFEENRTKKVNKSRKGTQSGEINEHKLKGLKRTDSLSNMFEDQEGGMLDYYDLTTQRGKKGKKKVTKDDENRTKQKIFKLEEITIPETITVKDFAAELKKTTAEIIKKLLGYGIMATINNEIDFDTASLIADEFGVRVNKKETVTEEDILFDDSEDREEDLEVRPPVVVVMGHVDHGKTSLLDAVKQTHVIEGEAGGITQHIGAYKVKINDREITFLDTPGHEAFTAMRARGAQITDIAILVVAANDGVMPQTVEAISHAKSAGIPIIVAVNKIDLPDANIDKVKQELMTYELVPEEWGGDTIFVPISAKKHQNIDQLLEMVLLEADVLELKSNPKKQAKGVVIEARLDKNKGTIASILVQRGTLDVGDTIVVGSSIGRIRTMTDEKGKKLKKAGPSTPVEIMGLTEVPQAGDIFYEVKDEKTAKHLIEKRKRQEREKAINAMSKVTLDNLFNQMEEGNLKVLNLIVKADVQGSVEAIKQSMEKLSNEEVKVKVIHAAAGAVTESDVTLAKVSNAIIIAFNVRPMPTAKDMAEKDEIEIKQYSVIYQAIDDVESAMKGMLAPKYKENIIGNAEVRQTFKISNVGTIAGAYVLDGKLERNAGVRVLRDNVVIHDGKLASLKRFKDDAKEVTKGYECGIQIEKYNDIKEGDIIEAYILEEIKR
ncbi:MAG: translation initiation factor IF-2 [Clostridia bacterium]|nr:translation initiation factor IF-2 [Clostridia bacterium]